jgi:hypothetical protein
LRSHRRGRNPPATIRGFPPANIRQGFSPTAPRDLIRARTVEGRERAKARGVALGRKPKLTPARETLSDIARSYNVSHSTISRLEA